ncbi:hypothetical protein GCM10007874_02780 [Labrys miyagiensis]|uniref:DUF3108 domain-containing protein n=1 Tax=Labrys miyagiensis TaxID=346912 RepID=A0ABQ6CAD9_9HYPH|nr:hypothetical protein GCM10007874_02780 [Labrys miyagiensis]
MRLRSAGNPAGETGVTLSTFSRFALGTALSALTGLAPALASAGSTATTIRYGVTLAGLPIGTANLNINLSDGGPYKINAAAKVGGVISLISDGRGSASASGRLTSTVPIPSAYALNSIAGKKPQTVQMALASGNITAVELQPELPPRKDRVPVTTADKHGVLDPLSAMLVPVSGNGDALEPAACRRTLPVFDGATRFDVKLSYARTENVDGKGYSGPTIVCSARYVPIAGHRPDRDQTKFMVANRDIELWLAPLKGTHVLAPFKIIVGTQIGRLTLDATRFGGSGGDD